MVPDIKGGVHLRRGRIEDHPAAKRLMALDEKEMDTQPPRSTPEPATATISGPSSSSSSNSSGRADLTHWPSCSDISRTVANPEWRMANLTAIMEAIKISGYWPRQLDDTPPVLLPLQLFLSLIAGWHMLETRLQDDRRSLSCGCNGGTPPRLQLESEVAASTSARIWVPILPSLPAQPSPVLYETVDRLQQPVAFEVLTSHFKRMWKVFPAALFGSGGGWRHAGEVLSAPAVVWVLRVHNDYCHRRYLQEMAAVANRRRLSRARDADAVIPIADGANEQRLFQGTHWHCGRTYDATRLGGQFTACGHPLCSLCAVTSGSLNLDSSKRWDRLGHCHSISAHSSRAHCDATSTHSGGLQAMVMVRAALGDIHRVDDRADPSCVRHYTAPPAGCDSVMADFQCGKQPHPVDDPTVAVYNSNALFASYIIIYSPTVSRP